MSSHCLQILPRLALLTYLNNEPFRSEREGEERERETARGRKYGVKRERERERETARGRTYGAKRKRERMKERKERER